MTAGERGDNIPYCHDATVPGGSAGFFGDCATGGAEIIPIIFWTVVVPAIVAGVIATFNPIPVFKAISKRIAIFMSNIIWDFDAGVFAIAMTMAGTGRCIPASRFVVNACN